MSQSEDTQPEESEVTPGRERGIIASPAKLHEAMLIAGFRSKSDLARKIQQLEELDRPPRSLVSRVFSQPVDIKSLERVASALGCPPWTLYSNADDTPGGSAVAAESTISSPDLINTKPQHHWKWASMVALLTLTFGLVMMSQWSEKTGGQESGFAPLGQGVFYRNIVAVMPVVGDDSERTYTRMLEQAVAEVSTFVPGSTFRFSASLSPTALISEDKAELVVTGEVLSLGKALLMRLSLYDEEGMRYFWTGHFPSATSNAYMSQVIYNAVLNFDRGIDSPVTPDWDTYKMFVEGLGFLDGERNEANLLKLSDIVNRTLRQFPDFADAHAVMCNVLVQQHILTGQKSYLADAEPECATALALNETSPTALLANAALARKAGDPDSAIVFLDQLFEADPEHTGGMQLFAETEIQRFRQRGDQAYIASAESTLLKAIALEPDQWKFPFTLARVYFFTGEVEKAIARSREAAQDWEGLETLTNMGSYQFCYGDLAAARETYQKALAYSPEHPVITSNLATLYYYLEQYDQALNIYQQLEQKETQETELYQYWVNLADTYLHLGEHERAESLYLKSLDYLDSVLAKGEASDMQKAVRISVYVRLMKLDSTLNSPELLASMKEEALELEKSKDLLTRFHLSLSWLNMGDKDRAFTLKQSIEGSCPGFVASPDFTI